MRFRSAIYAIIGVMTVHAIATIFSLYYRISTFDIWMHFAGGVVMAMLALAVMQRAGLTHSSSRPLWFDFLFVLSFVMLTAVLWEFGEYTADQLIRDKYPLGYNQLSIRDTMGDLLMGGFGGILSYLFFNKR